jgi:hypothetical protein
LNANNEVVEYGEGDADPDWKVIRVDADRSILVVDPAPNLELV